MREGALTEIQATVAELRQRAKESQDNARRTLNPLFDDERHRPPRDFVESSFLFIRSCDPDIGSRPFPCPVFWLSPDLRVAPLSNLGAATQELTAGDAYRLTATVRNRGDLMVPSAKVEFYLVNPSLGFDVRFATKLGVAAGRVHAHGASEISLDYVVPPSLSGHRCLFARIFSFSPLDIPIDDFALDPRIDRHVGQLNLNIIGQGSTFALDWIHHRNAAERLEIVPMTAPMIRALRREQVTGFTLQSGALWREVAGRVTFDVEPAEGPAVKVRRRSGGLVLASSDGEAASIERQAELMERMLSALRALEHGRGSPSEHRDLFREFRGMTKQAVRTRVVIRVPDLGLKPRQAVALNVVRRGTGTDEVRGGIGLFVHGRGE